jgi:hypothetical protein
MGSSSRNTPGVFVDGWRRAIHAPAIVAGVFVMTFLLALPLAYTMRGLLQTHLGRSTVAASAADSVNYDWWQEFTSQASGLGTTFTPTIIGFAATLDSVSSVVDGQVEIVPIVAAIATYLGVWTFLVGGILDRFARRRRTRVHGFFAAAGVFFFRFLRLAVAAGVVYWFVFAYVHQWLFEDWYPDLTRGMDTERRVFAVRASMYGLFGALLVAVNLLFDYAKIRMVVEDRRSAIGGLLAALRFILRNPGATFGLYALNALAFLVVVGIWAVAAPGVTGAGASMWVAFVAGQLYVLARLLLKLQFLASQTALFQSRLAHAGYAAGPPATWPESPSAEALWPAAPAPQPRRESV